MELREAEDFLTDFFKELGSRPDLTDRNVLEKIVMRSCKSAVKGGDVLTEAEIDALLKLEIPDDAYFNDRGIYNYHGGSVVFDDTAVLNWILEQSK